MGLLEVKCPWGKGYMTLQQACEDKRFLCDNKGDDILLKRNHPYYYQVQGQMAISGVTWCDFIVYTFEDLHIERIQADRDIWNKIHPKLVYFLKNAMVPELILK